jgi:hypothetical protein
MNSLPTLLAGLLALSMSQVPPPTTPAGQAAQGAPRSEVQVDYDHDVDFSRYRTFAWAPFLQPLPNADNNSFIQDSIERLLGTRGFKKVTAGPADVYVNYWAKIDSKVRGRPTEQPNAWQPTQPIVTVDLEREKTGTLGIQFYDARSNNLIWGAKAPEALGPSKATDARIDELVSALLAGFPPKPIR